MFLCGLFYDKKPIIVFNISFTITFTQYYKKAVKVLSTLLQTYMTNPPFWWPFMAIDGPQNQYHMSLIIVVLYGVIRLDEDYKMAPVGL